MMHITIRNKIWSEENKAKKEHTMHIFFKVKKKNALYNIMFIYIYLHEIMLINKNKIYKIIINTYLGVLVSGLGRGE